MTGTALAPATAKDYEITVRIANGRIRAACAARGWNQSDLARASKVDATSISGFCNFRKSPIHRRTGEWVATALRVAAALTMLPEDLWPEHLRATRESRKTALVSGEEMRRLAEGAFASERAHALAPDAPDAVYDRKELSGDLPRKLKRASPRQEKAIRALYGLDGAEPMTLQAIGDSLGVSRERARQLINQGMRRIRCGERVEDARPPPREMAKARDRIEAVRAEAQERARKRGALVDAVFLGLQWRWPPTSIAEQFLAEARRIKVLPARKSRGFWLDDVTKAIGVTHGRLTKAAAMSITWDALRAINREDLWG